MDDERVLTEAETREALIEQTMEAGRRALGEYFPEATFRSLLSSARFDELETIRFAFLETSNRVM